MQDVKVSNVPLQVKITDLSELKAMFFEFTAPLKIAVTQISKEAEQQSESLEDIEKILKDIKDVLAKKQTIEDIEKNTSHLKKTNDLLDQSNKIFLSSLDKISDSLKRIEDKSFSEDKLQNILEKSFQNIFKTLNIQSKSSTESKILKNGLTGINTLLMDIATILESEFSGIEDVLISIESILDKSRTSDTSGRIHVDRFTAKLFEILQKYRPTGSLEINDKKIRDVIRTLSGTIEDDILRAYQTIETNTEALKKKGLPKKEASKLNEELLKSHDYLQKVSRVLAASYEHDLVSDFNSLHRSMSKFGKDTNALIEELDNIISIDKTGKGLRHLLKQEKIKIGLEEQFDFLSEKFKEKIPSHMAEFQKLFEESLKDINKTEVFSDIAKIFAKNIGQMKGNTEKIFKKLDEALKDSANGTEKLKLLLKEIKLEEDVIDKFNRLRISLKGIGEDTTDFEKKFEEVLRNGANAANNYLQNVEKRLDKIEEKRRELTRAQQDPLRYLYDNLEKFTSATSIPSFYFIIKSSAELQKNIRNLSIQMDGLGGSTQDSLNNIRSTNIELVKSVNHLYTMEQSLEAQSRIYKIGIRDQNRQKALMQGTAKMAKIMGLEFGDTVAYAAEVSQYLRVTDKDSIRVIRNIDTLSKQFGISADKVMDLQKGLNGVLNNAKNLIPLTSDIINNLTKMSVAGKKFEVEPQIQQLQEAFGDMHKVFELPIAMRSAMINSAEILGQNLFEATYGGGFLDNTEKVNKQLASSFRKMYENIKSNAGDNLAAMNFQLQHFFGIGEQGVKRLIASLEGAQYGSRELLTQLIEIQHLKGSEFTNKLSELQKKGMFIDINLNDKNIKEQIKGFTGSFANELESSLGTAIQKIQQEQVAMKDLFNLKVAIDNTEISEYISKIPLSLINELKNLGGKEKDFAKIIEELKIASSPEKQLQLMNQLREASEGLFKSVEDRTFEEKTADWQTQILSAVNSIKNNTQNLFSWIAELLGFASPIANLLTKSLGYLGLIGGAFIFFPKILTKTVGISTAIITALGKQGLLDKTKGLFGASRAGIGSKSVDLLKKISLGIFSLSKWLTKGFSGLGRIILGGISTPLLAIPAAVGAMVFGLQALYKANEKRFQNEKDVQIQNNLRFSEQTSLLHSILKEGLDSKKIDLSQYYKIVNIGKLIGNQVKSLDEALALINSGKSERKDLLEVLTQFRNQQFAEQAQGIKDPQSLYRQRILIQGEKYLKELSKMDQLGMLDQQEGREGAKLIRTLMFSLHTALKQGSREDIQNLMNRLSDKFPDLISISSSFEETMKRHEEFLKTQHDKEFGEYSKLQQQVYRIAEDRLKSSGLSQDKQNELLKTITESENFKILSAEKYTENLEAANKAMSSMTKDIENLINKPKAAEQIKDIITGNYKKPESKISESIIAQRIEEKPTRTREDIVKAIMATRRIDDASRVTMYKPKTTNSLLEQQKKTINAAEQLIATMAPIQTIDVKDFASRIKDQYDQARQATIETKVPEVGQSQLPQASQSSIPEAKQKVMIDGIDEQTQYLSGVNTNTNEMVKILNAVLKALQPDTMPRTHTVSGSTPSTKANPRNQLISPTSSFFEQKSAWDSADPGGIGAINASGSIA